MLWRKGILLLLLLQITVFARGKRRIRKRDAASDPLLAEIFKATDNEIKQSRERRPDRALDPGEELEAILTGFKHKDKHLLAENGPIKRDSGPDPRQNELDQQNIMLGLNAQNAVTRDHIPVPEDNTNLMQIPGSPTAAYNQDFNQNLMQLPEEQQQLNGIPAASFMPLQQNIEKKQDDSQVQVKNIIPGRPEQKQNDWANQPGVTVYLHEDKKSSIPIPVKTAALAVQAKGSFPLQMRKISPNMKIGAVVPHHAEYGETVESVTTKPEEIIAKKSEIPHSDSSKKSQVEKEATKESTTKNEVAKPVKSGDAAKKDFVQQPFMTQQQQQQAAFQTASQFGALQGGQDATFAQAVPVQAAAAVAAPQAVAPAVIAQPAAMAAPAAASAPAVPGEPCEDQYNTCADFAKNEYCVKYPAQMSIQCRKSCKFCVAPISPPLDAKQQIATAVPAAPAAPVAQNAAGAQALPVPSKSGATEESSGSGSGDSSGSGDAPGDVPVAKRSQFKGSGRPNSMYLPELGSGDDSGSGSGETFASGSEAAVVRQLASAQNIVSGVGQEATARSNIQSKNITVQQPIMKSFLKPKKNFPSANVKKSNIPQRPVSPLTAMDVENVNDDEDDASGSGSGSGSGDFGPQQRQEIERKSKIPVTPKKEQVSKKSKISKKSNIAKKPVPAAAPAPAAPLKLSSAYPRIDLRKIAAALARYEESALTLAGEYPRISSPDNDVVTRSQIPRPGNFLSSFNKLRQNIQIAKLVTQQNQKRFEIPKYLLVGDRISESGGIAQETSVPAADSVESIAERFAAAGLKPSMQEIYAETGKPMFESEAAKRMRIAKRKKKKFQKPVDPFEYLRNMPAGASMEPIIDPHAVSSTRESVSYPVYLMKVMPGSHKYVPASTRSKVNAIPKKAESNPNPAPVAPAKQSTQEENANAKSEFETGPGPELDSAAATEPIPDVNSAPQSEIELGPVQERPAPQAVSEPEPAPAVQQPEPAPAMQQPQPNGAENLRQERPALRTKMLSAFFHNKKSNDEAGSGSGEGEGGHARHDIAGEGSGSEFGDGGNAKAMSLQKLLQSEEGPRPEFAKMKENIQHFFDAPVAAQKEANYFQTTNPSNYLESNLAALTPESAVVAPNAFSTQSGLTAGASGSRITMSKTQETKWMRPDVGSELASIMPETNSQAETRTISTQAPVQTASMYRTPNPDSFIQAKSFGQISSIYQQAMRSQAPIGPQQVQFREPQRSPIIQPQTQMSPQAFIGQAPQQRPVQDLVQFKTQTIHQEMAHKKNLIKHKPDLDCGEGWEGASGDFGTFCYKFMNVKTVFDDAQAECQRLNSNLFSILNPYENRYIHDNFHEKLWIGYRDKGMDGSWNWTDGSRGIYTNWASEADDDNGQRRDCVILQADEGKWKDMPCTSNFRFLCKHKPGKCPKNWKKLNLNSVSGCYHMFQDKKTWEEAEQECENYDAHLVSILTEDEQTMIYQVYSSRNYWIGFNDKDSEGDWQWSDRLTSSYTNWDDKSPNNGGVSCAAFAEGGHWHDEPCMEKLPFICKRKGPKGEHILGVDDEGILKPVSRLLDKDEAARNEQINKGGPKPVVPSQFWPLLKNTKSGLSGNRPITVHGNLTSVPGGISLNGRDQYLDGGDFHGKCISDPDKCSKGLSVAIQVYLDDSVRKYKEPHCILDTSGGSKGFTIYVQKNKMHYKVITREKVWELATDITTNRWQEIVMTWHNYKGITLFVNGAFKDSAENGKNTGILREDATPRLLISRRATDLKPFAYTKMVIASLSVFSKQLSIEDVTYAFTFDDTVVANYRWLMPHMVGKKIPFASDIFVQKDVGDMDGGLAISGQKGWLEIKDYDPCLKDPSECHHGFALSFKLKLDQDVREYKKARYIIDSGGHQDGVKGVSVYILNDNLYFQVIMSPEEDIMIWTVRVPIYTVRWQRVVMTWRLDKGLWVYVDGAFRGLTKTPKTLPVVFKKEPELLVIGRKNVGPEFNGAQFGIGSLAIFSRFLTRKETEHVFAVKDNPFPGLIREVWRDIPGSTMAQLKSNPDYPNNPTTIEVIENFDAPFDIDKDYGSKLKGYFVAPETGNYTFYMSCSKSCELFTSGDEDTKNKTQIIQLEQATWHNQWNKYKNQTSKEINMIAGKYYYLEAVQKGEDSSDSLSVGVRLPSGRYQRPINKENLQWRLKGNPYAGVIREVWFDVPGYQVSDLTSDPNFPNNPSSTEVLDKMDAPYNIGDNYGSRLSGYFRAPETGDYRFYLASDTTGELWLSSDESESNLVKIVTLNGWTDHNQWLKFPEQRSDKVFLMVGKYYYIRAYQKADKLGDCASVAVELPSGHFEGPIKRKHLSWKLPGGKVGPGPNDLSEALPKPMGLYQLNEASLRDIISGDNGLIIHNIELTTGPDGVKDTAFEFKGKQDSYLEIPNDKHSLDAKNSITLLANIYPTGEDGPILNYRRDGWGVHIWQFDKTMLFVRFVSRDDGMTTQPLATRVLQLNSWNQVGASYDNNTGVSQLWHDGKMVKSRNIGQLELSTQYPIRVGAREGDDRHFKGKVACIQIYGKALTEQQIGELRRCPKGDGAQSDSLLAMTQAGSGSETGAEDSFAMENRVGEDTEEELAVNRCDPNPCINGAKCANDERKVDGYKCLCTSDFTGKNCQVSKPAAENPIVKRMNIPKYPKAVSSENYSKLEKKNPVKAEDEREDVFLLYQKLGCYKDDVKRHDLPNPVSIKATTQEECVRACALQDKGYAYFGLQNGKDCYCGKHYGKYGKVDNKLCAKTCEGNPMESCGGDNANQVFFYGLGTNYTVKTYTGNQFGSGTDAKIFLEVIGERGSSDFRQLDSGLSKFEPGSVDTKTFVLPDLGKLKRVRVLHDNSGAAPSWFLKKITITDEEGNSTEFPCNDWLSDTQGGGKLERELIANAVKTDQKSKS